MPVFIALDTGLVNELESISVVAMPAALADTAALICDTICEATELVDPVHFGLGRPSSAAASAMPYWVGTKKLFVVTWLTNQNCHAGVFGKLPATEAPEVVLAVVPEELHAASRAEAAAVALTSPVPFSNRRRVGPSFMFSFSIASSTLGSTLSITGLHHFLGAGMSRRPWMPGGHHAPRPLFLLIKSGSPPIAGCPGSPG